MLRVPPLPLVILDPEAVVLLVEQQNLTLCLRGLLPLLLQVHPWMIYGAAAVQALPWRPVYMQEAVSMDINQLTTIFLVS